MPPKRQLHMIRATLISLWCNIVLVSIKTTALIVVGSLAIAVDLGISIVGLMISIILYYSIKLSTRPADPLHNYGYGKIENVCEILEGLVLIGIAVAMSSQAMLYILNPKPLNMPYFGIISCGINACINFGGSFYILKMAKKSRSPAIHAEAVHYRMEGVISSMIGTSFVIAIVMMSQKSLSRFAPYVDPIAAFMVSVFLIIPSFKIAKNAFFKLLDSSIGEDSQMEILKPLSKYVGEYCEFKDLRTRTAGRTKFVDFKLVVPENISFKEGNKIAEKLEKEILSNVPHCEVLIKLEPCKNDCTFVQDGDTCPYHPTPEKVQ